MDLKNVNNLLDIILAMDESKGSATIRPKSTRNIKFILKFYWNDEINCLHKLKKFAMVNYFRNMTLKNLIEFKKQNVIFKKKLKQERTKAWKAWAESLSPNSPTKDIFRRFKILSNHRVNNRYVSAA